MGFDSWCYSIFSGLTCYDAMIFTNAEQLGLPCRFERYVTGDLHADGRRYLPLLVFGLLQPVSGGITQIGVVDRHHQVEPTLTGREGTARLVLLLSSLRLIKTPRSGFFDQNIAHGRASTMPEAYGRVVAVPAWEVGTENLPYETLYTELLLDIGSGVVGVRTSTTGVNLTTQIGKPRLEPDDWIVATRSRIDVLKFTPYD